MAHSVPSRFRLTHVNIILPRRGSTDATCIDESSGKVRVLVQNPQNHVCVAEISDFVPGSGIGGVHDTMQLVRIGTTDLYHAYLEVGTISGPQVTNNRAFEITDNTAGEGEQYPIRVIHCGSGSGSHTSSTVEAARVTVWPAGKPIPMELVLKLDSPVRPGHCSYCDQLNRPTVLTHAQDASFICCWFSRPLDFCADGAEPGWWMLQRSENRTWTLRLRYQNATIVTYQLTTATDNDCTFPLQLSLVGAGGPECNNWPRTVTIAPAK